MNQLSQENRRFESYEKTVRSTIMHKTNLSQANDSPERHIANRADNSKIRQLICTDLLIWIPALGGAHEGDSGSGGEVSGLAEGDALGLSDGNVNNGEWRSTG